MILACVKLTQNIAWTMVIGECGEDRSEGDGDNGGGGEPGELGGESGWESNSGDR